MPLPNSPFAPQTTPTMAELDQTFAAVAALGIVPCTAAGTNLITLSPAANTPSISAYANFLQFSFVAVNTSNGSVTLQVGSLPALPVYAADGTTQLGNKSIQATDFYVVAFNQALNGGNGGWTVVSASATGVTAGTYSGQVTFTADASGRITSATSSAATAVQFSRFLFSTTFSTPSGTGITTVYKFTVVGGGGGGGACSNANGGAGGGGGGGTAIAFLSGVTSGTSITVTVASGGNGGTSTSLAGSGGGTSSIVFSGVTVSASGGNGGSGQSGATLTTSGNGGVGSNGALNMQGGPGTNGGLVSASIVLSGGGGNSFMGGGGAGINSAGLAGGLFGGGGSGGAGVNAGGLGASGVVVAEWVQ